MKRKSLKAKMLSVLLAASMFLMSCSSGMAAYAADGTVFDAAVSDVETSGSTETDNSMETNESVEKDADNVGETNVDAVDAGGDAETGAETDDGTKTEMETGESTDIDENAETDGNAETGKGTGMETSESIIDMAQETGTAAEADAETAAVGLSDPVLSGLDYVELNNNYDTSKVSVRWYEEQGLAAVVNENLGSGRELTEEYAAYVSSKGASNLYVSGFASIADSAFKRFKCLQNVTVADTLEKIGNWTFMDCSSLESIDFPDTLTQIGAYAFYGCRLLRLAELPEGITSLETGAFWNCESITLKSLPSRINRINNFVFSGCSLLELDSLPEDIDSIGNQAFSDCASLALTKLPESITSIGNGAFGNCGKLVLEGLPAGVASIGDAAFSGCALLDWTELPSGITSIAGAAFYDCTSLALTDLPAGVVSIGASAFHNCMSLALTKLPSSLQVIKNYGFSNCTGLQIAEFPDGLESVGKGAFEGCNGLTVEVLPESLASIGEYAFFKCSGLQEIDIRGEAAEIAESVFGRCGNLRSVHLPDTVKSIGQYAFSMCGSLEQVNLPDGLESIGWYAFQFDSQLELDSLPESLAELGGYAFYLCTKVSITSFPDSLKTVEERAFWKADGTIVSEPNHASVSEKSAVQTFYTVRCITGTSSEDYDESSVIGTDRYVGYYGDDVSDYVTAHSAKHPEIDGHQFVSYVVPEGNEKIILMNGDAETVVYAVYVPDVKSTFTVALPASVEMGDFRIAGGGEALGVFAGKIDYQVSYKLKDSNATLAVYLQDSCNGSSNSSYLQPGQTDSGCFNAETGGSIVCDTDKSRVAWTNGNVKTGAYNVFGRFEGQYGTASYDSDSGMYVGSGTIALSSSFSIKETGAYCGHVTVNICCR